MRWIIGDIHGMLRPLEALIDLVDEADDDAELLFCGDYVNRGPDSRGVLELLSDIDGARFVRGNHDDIFDLVLSGTCYAPHPSLGDPVMAFMMFLQHGLDRTLASYGVDPADLDRFLRGPSRDAMDKLVSIVPRSHRVFLRELPAVIDDPDLFVAHAYWEPAEPSEQPSLSARLAGEPARRIGALWGRYTAEQVLAPKAWGRHGYFGHTPVDSYPELLRDGGMVPIAGPGVTLLDTGCALISSGRLSAVCHEERMLLQVDRHGHVAEDR